MLWKNSKYSECVFAGLVFQFSELMRNAVLLFGPDSLYFFTLPHKRHDIWGKVAEHNMPV
jgi:hypothetical protein